MLFKIEVERQSEWEQRGRYIEVEAKNVHAAMKEARKQMADDEDIYQISVNGQMVYDYFNGTSIYPDIRE